MRWSFCPANQGSGWPEGAVAYIIGAMAKPDSTAPNAADPVANTTGANPPAANPPAANPLAKSDLKAHVDAGQVDAGQVDVGQASKRPREIGGPTRLEPTRYGDWERNGRVSDF
jgi:hypothetical protein